MELEIKHLEQYLLTLYRKAFEQAPTLASSLVVRPEEPAPPKPSVSSRSALMEETPKAKATVGRGGDAMLHYSCPPLSKRRNGTMEDCSPSTCPTKAMDSDHGLRSQSALSFRGVCSSRISPSEESLARALRSCHSQPFSFLEVIHLNLLIRQLPQFPDAIQTVSCCSSDSNILTETSLKFEKKNVLQRQHSNSKIANVAAANCCMV